MSEPRTAASSGGRGRKPRPVADRLWEKVDRSAGADACWLYRGNGSAPPVLSLPGGRNIPARRVAFELANGPASEDQIVYATCDNNRCCNPAHLYLGEPRVQIADAVLTETYARLGSVHKVGAELGIDHSTAHRRLRGLGLAKSIRVFTVAEHDEIRRFYTDTAEEHFDLDRLCERLGRSKTTVCREARLLGLTAPRGKHRRSRAARDSYSEAAKERIATNGHPRGMLGKVHAAETKATIGAKSRDVWLVHKTFGIGNMSPEARQRRSDQSSARMAGRPAENAYSRAKRGRRPDLGETFFRSAWEANFARYLNWLVSRGEIDGWSYEPDTFWFEAIRRGVRSYTPDFRVVEKGRTYYYEVKGWLDDKSKTKLKRMKKYHPTVEVRLFGEKDYRAMASKLSRLIQGWE